MADIDDKTVKANDKATTHKVRNTAQGPRGLHAVNAAGDTEYVEVAPGQTVPVKLSAHEFASAKRTGYFHFDKDADADNQADDTAEGGEGLPNNVMKLKGLAKAEGIDVSGASTAADLQRTILAARAAKVAAANPPAPPTDDLDNLSDDDLRNTVAAITGQTAPDSADRTALLKLARGQA